MLINFSEIFTGLLMTLKAASLSPNSSSGSSFFLLLLFICLSVFTPHSFSRFNFVPFLTFIVFLFLCSSHCIFPPLGHSSFFHSLFLFLHSPFIFLPPLLSFLIFSLFSTLVHQFPSFPAPFFFFFPIILDVNSQPHTGEGRHNPLPFSHSLSVLQHTDVIT